MNNKIIRYLILGLGLYAVIATLVIVFYDDDPQNMHWEDREAFNVRFLEKLSLEDFNSLDTILNEIGAPDLTFAKQVDDDRFQIIYYRTQHVHSDGITTMDECTGLLFKNNLLIAWGPGAQTAFDKAHDHHE